MPAAMMRTVFISGKDRWLWQEQAKSGLFSCLPWQSVWLALKWQESFISESVPMQSLAAFVSDFPERIMKYSNLNVCFHLVERWYQSASLHLFYSITKKALQCKENLSFH